MDISANARPAGVISLGALLLVSSLGCSPATGPSTTDASVRATRVRDCNGPATSLPAALAAELPPPGRIVTHDDDLAELSRRAPGGFAGVLLDDGKPVILLVDTTAAAAAKAGVASYYSEFDVAGAEVREARWTFAQLYDWYRYVNQTIFQDAHGLTSTDIDDASNRIRYGVIDDAARTRILEVLAGLALPCDLVLVDIQAPTILH